MLSDKQRTAIVMIVAGRRFTEVEKQVRVSHSQCSRWRKDPEFAAELHEARMRFHEAQRDKLWSLSDSAMDVVADALSEGDRKTAMGVLRLVGPGLTNPNIDIASREELLRENQRNHARLSLLVSLIQELVDPEVQRSLYERFKAFEGREEDGPNPPVG